MMADEMPMIPKAGGFYIHTGNIVNWNRSKKNLTQTPNEELTECINSTIRDWVQKADRTEIQDATNIDCLNKKFLSKLPEAEREGLKVTVKIFLCQMEKSTVIDAVGRALCELGISYIETVLLSVPENKVNLDDLKPAWEALEEMVKDEKILTLGIADLNKDQLEELYNWAQVKPCTAQVNLASCCVVPPEMHEYARSNDIQLLTHNDPTDVLSSKAFQEVVAAQTTPRDGEGWALTFIDRYSVVIKSRGVIKTKGYILKSHREIKER